MIITIATLFPDLCERVLSESIIGRARKRGDIEVECVQIRDFAEGKHKQVDDRPYGGGYGMLLKAEPIFRCYEDAVRRHGVKPHVIYLSPRGRVFSQEITKELAQHEYLFLLCGHYEGIDQRLLDRIVDEELSIGDFVLTGGELPALIVADAVARLCDGVLADPMAHEEESHTDGVLEYPQYTMPPIWEGMEVPPVLRSGDHGKVEDWRRKQSLIITKENRPDLFEKIDLTKKDKSLLSEED